jgi:Flp pilus assembly protein TadD
MLSRSKQSIFLMHPNRIVFALAPLFVMTASAQEVAPEKALKYHEVLMKRPQNAALFDRFYGAWIDEQTVEKLEAFLVSQAEKNGGQAWSVLARYQMRRGLEENALTSLAKAMESVPDDVTLPMERAKIRLRRLEFSEAREDLAKVVAGKDEALALEAAKMTGKSWLREGNSAEAVKAWDSLLAENPGDEDLLEDLVENAAAEGEVTQALAYVDKLIKASSDPYKKTLRSLRRGDLLAQSGKVDEAVEAYGATLAQVGEGSWLEREVLAQVEKIFRKQDRLGDLAEQLKKLAEANPRRLLIHRQLAKLEAAQGETDSAIGRFREVLKRSPGDRELREEFVNLLTDSERFDDAAAEMEKMIELNPADSGLLLQLAGLRSRQEKPEAVLEALKKAHGLLGNDEGSGIRIAGLMLQYGLNDAGEALLKQLAATPGAGPAPAETLAAHFGRTNRKTEALELLKKVGAADDADVVVRVAGSVSALGDNEAALAILAAKAEKFSSESRFLAAHAQAALAAKKPQEAVAQVVKLVRLSKQSGEIAESVSLAARVMVAAEKVADVRETLEAQASRTAAETCLLAVLMEGVQDFDGVTKLLETATDPLLLHFYAALLDRRGDYEPAIAALSRLADTDEGRKAAFFKDLSELQQRAGKSADALATVERWKQSAPGDKAAWLATSRLLRDGGKPEEAIKIMRQAVARFEGDTDLAASLASLHEESGQWPEADAIYWRLYDEAESPTDQGRWAGQLAQLAMRTGKTDVLDEKLQERARGNRRSLGPLLAQAELARVTRNEDKRRDLLLEAVRLQPKDVDLRLQIANLEEQAGNHDRVVAVLEEALAGDTTGRIRAALGQAYIRQGQVVKGLRELQAVSGKQSNDPRAIETMAATLAGAGMYEEAINFLRESFPDGGDWRCQYLLGVMLEQDGRESEALPVFIALQKAEGEIKGLKPNTNNQAQYIERYPEETRGLMRLMMAAQMAYAHKRDLSYGGSYFGGSPLTGPFALPEEAVSARTMALTHLGELAKKGSSDVKAQLEAAGITRLDFIADFLAASKDQRGRPDYIPLLKKYPEETGLLDLAVMYSGYGNGDDADMDLSTLRQSLEKNVKISPPLRFHAWMMISKQNPTDEAAWTAVFKAAEECLTSKDPKMIGPVASQLQLIYQTTSQDSPISDKHRDSIKKLILAFATANDENSDPKYDLESTRLSGLAIAGTREQWIDAFNAMLKKFRSQSNSQAAANPYQIQAQMYAMRGYSRFGDGQDPFMLPTLETLSFSSLPNVYQYQIGRKTQNPGYSRNASIPAEELLKISDRFESPLVRAWVAICADDATALEKALAVTPPREEAADFVTLRAHQAVTKKNYPEAYQLLDQLRILRATDRRHASFVSLAMVAAATEMKPEEREKIAESLREVLVQCRHILGNEGAPILAVRAKQLGFEELAKRFQVVGTGPNTQSALGPAGFGPASSRPSSSRPTGPGTVERLMKLAAEKKYEPAAREALAMIRQAKSSQYRGGSSNPQEWLPKLPSEVRDTMIKLVDPGDTKSLTKRLEYAEITAMLDKKDLALAAFEQLLKDRPSDPSLAAKLVFLLPSDQRERAIKLMTQAAHSEDFVSEASSKAEQLGRDDKKLTQAIDFFETVGLWLESASAESLENANLTWVSYHAKPYFFEYRSPNLFEKLPEKIENKPLFDKRVAVAKQLTLALIKHPATAEEGFRLLSACKAWEFSPEVLDTKARETLINLLGDDKLSRRNYQFFTLVSPNQISSFGEDLDGNSSIRWLTGRMAKAKSPDEILPPAYLQELKSKNPKVSELVSALVGLSNADQLAKLWDSEALKSPDNNPVMTMLRGGVIARASSVPGASKFFASRLSELKPQEVFQDLQQGRGKSQSLMTAALSAGIAGNQEDLEDICKEIYRALFGDKVDWDNLQDSSGRNEVYYRMNALENILRQQPMDPVSSMKLNRILFRLGVPIGDDDYDAFRVIQNCTGYATVEEAEAFLESIGFLEDISTWEPAAAWVIESQQSNGKTVSLRSLVLLSEKISSYIGLRFSHDLLVKRLKERQPATFGSLITAASFVSGKERQELTAAAFAAAGPALAKMPKDRIEKIALMLPWLPSDAVEKLPPVFKTKSAELNEARRKQLRKIADDFLASNDPQQLSYGNDPFHAIKQMLGELIALDFDKAVEVFLEAERRFTESLSRGGRISNYTSNGIQISSRDRSINDVFNRSDDESDRLALRLRWLAHILRSPQGGRFSLAETSYEGEPLLMRIGTTMRRTATNEPEWQRAMKSALEMPEELRGDALIAIVCGELYQMGNLPDSSVIKSRTALSTLAEPFKRALPYRAVSFGLSGWNADSAEGRTITSKALTEILADQSVSEHARMQLAIAAVIKAPNILASQDAADSIASLIEAYFAAERSAINPMVIRLMGALTESSSAPAPPAARRIHDAFWSNANSIKAGGHPPIPQNVASSLFIAAAIVGDTETAKKLRVQAGQTLIGDIVAITSLISAKQFELAKQLLPEAGRSYTAPSNSSENPYSQTLEEQLPNFGATIADPLQFLRLECNLLALTSQNGGPAPRESIEYRAMRLAQDYQKSPPKDRLINLELLAAISDKSPSAALTLEGPIRDLARTINIESALHDRALRSSPSDGLNPRQAIANLEFKLAVTAALSALLKGDAELLEKTSKALVTCPALQGDQYHPNFGLQDSLNLFYKTTLTACCSAVASGETSGLKKALDSLEPVALAADDRSNISNKTVESYLVLCQFLARMTDQPERTAALFQRLKRKNLVSKLTPPDGFAHLTEIMARYSVLRSKELSESRKRFLVAIFSRESLAPYFPWENKWIKRMGRSGMDPELVALADPVPPEFIPKVRAVLINHRADLIINKNPAQAAEIYRAALTICSEEAEYNELRAIMKYGLASALWKSKRIEEAKSVYADIPANEVGAPQKKLYEQLGKALAQP